MPRTSSAFAHIYRPLTESVRELIDATIRTAARRPDGRRRQGPDRCRRRPPCAPTQLDGPFGVRFTAHGDRMPWGNAVIGLRNPIAPPLYVQHQGRRLRVRRFHARAPPMKVRRVMCTGEWPP